MSKSPTETSEPDDQEIGLRSLQQLSGKRFWIPAYQRGYRWEAEQVTALLNDLAEFENSPQNGQFYCLQPLVVFENKDRDGMLDVVDGQQRLTTLFLILRKLGGGVAPFHIQYERHPETPSGLDGLLKMAAPVSPSEASPDLHFIRKAEESIQAWFLERSNLTLPSLTDRVGAYAKFIWHSVHSHQEAMRSFARLNGGKIKLKDAELIRAALLVRREDRSDADRQRIALRWDDMERRLQQPEFWSFLNQEVEPPDCCMEWLLRLTAPKEKSAKDAADHAVFEWFSKELEARKSAQLWEEIESLFGTLEEWFEDNGLFHLVGCLVHLGTDMRTLITAARQLRKDEFHSHLKHEIRNKVFGKLTSRGDIVGWLEGLKYNEHLEKVRRVLLVFNLAALEADQSGTIRFSFHAFRKQDWDIEHIHASASRLPETKKEYEGAFRELRDYFKRLGREEEVSRIDALLTDLSNSDSHDFERFRTSYSELIKGFNQDPDDGKNALSSGETDQLWNLTLLDASTNRGYGNHPFAIKRGWILDLDQSERYILPCTRNVFTKAYSREPINLLHWMKADAEDYLQAIGGRLKTFFNESWSVPLPGEASPQRHAQAPSPSAEVPTPKTITSRPPKSARVSFLELFDLAHHPQVEIPLLQRDYAQGRNSEALVRTAFLQALRKALIGNEPLNLDFVYGEVNGGRFQPIDGQQRLTTLFLLHWYIAGAAGKGDNFCARMRDGAGEPRFRYSVRLSSQRFFNELLNTSVIADASKPSDEIALQPWFFHTWKHDPTIKGALTMIDAIAETFKDSQDWKHLYAKLAAECGVKPITLDVLDLGSIGQSEEIYIKMNARGVELTGFEKFKAWLIETHGQLEWSAGVEIRDQWQVRLDGQWLELFWRFHHGNQSPSGPVSAAFSRTFTALAVNGRAAKTGVEWDNAWLDEEMADDRAFWPALFTKLAVTYVFDQLDSLSSPPALIADLRERLGKGHVAPFDGKPLLMPFFEKPQEDLTFTQRLWLHAVCLTLKASWAADAELHWFRVIRNLLAHSTIGKDNFRTALRALDTLADFASTHGSFLVALVKADLRALKALDSDQLKEECLKAGRILSPDHGSEWEQSIIKMENHPVFQGQIGALLQQETDLLTFQHRCSMVEKLWDKDLSLGGRRDEHLLARVILASSNPFDLGRQGSICLSNTGTNWRSLMSRQDGWPCFLEAVPKVLDSLTDSADMELHLRRIIEESKVEQSWMHNLIKHGNKLLKDTHGKVQQYYDNGTFVYRNSSHSHDTMDILIGNSAALRNHLIQGLIKTGAWTFPTGTENWRRVETDSGDVFFRGHHILLVRQLASGQRFSTLFGYHQLTIRVTQGDEKHEVSMDYPQNESPDSLHELLSKARDDHQNESVKTVVGDLLQACVSLSRIDISES